MRGIKKKHGYITTFINKINYFYKRLHQIYRIGLPAQRKIIPTGKIRCFLAGTIYRVCQPFVFL